MWLCSPVPPHCRHWQDLGYLIIYVTGRPDMQKQRVVAWLSQHNFPHGIVSFCDGLVHDPLRHKANFLKSLTEVRLGEREDWGKDSDFCIVCVCVCVLFPVESLRNVLLKLKRKNNNVDITHFYEWPKFQRKMHSGKRCSCLFDWFQAHMKIFAGYGSTKDISVYTSIGLPSSQIYIVGRPSKKMQHQCQVPFDTQPSIKKI